jgi:hypothetical protein
MHEEHLFLLMPSAIPRAGIGCFAASAIHQGAQLSRDREERFRRLPADEIPDAYLKYCVMLENGLFLAPEDYLRMGVFWYVNHARTPNLRFENGRLYAHRMICAGEELTLYYSDLLTHPKNLLWVTNTDI